MPDILMRNVPEPTYQALKRRAKRNHRSLQQELLLILETSAEGSKVREPAEIAAAIRARLARGQRAFGDSADLVREDRER